MIQRKGMTGRIVIIREPDCEVPLWVRMAWVGLELPCKPICGYPLRVTRQVLSKEPRLPRMEFEVPQREALDLLSLKEHKAAVWWYSHGFPNDTDFFYFGLNEAKILEGVTVQQIVVHHTGADSHHPPTIFRPR